MANPQRTEAAQGMSITLLFIMAVGTWLSIEDAAQRRRKRVRR
jgi:hypothetical protein